MKPTEPDNCTSCGRLLKLKAFGLCTSCYRKDYYKRNKQAGIDQAVLWNKMNKDSYNAQARINYKKLLVNKRCPKCNKQITVNTNKTTIKCNCCGVGFLIRKTLSISNKNKHGINLVPPD